MALPHNPTPYGLFGRDGEVADVQCALNMPAVRAVITVGAPGIGKSAVAEAALSRAAAAGTLTGRAQHRIGAVGDDLGPFLSALEQAVGAGLDLLHDPDAGLDLLARGLGPNAALLAQDSAGVFRLFRSLDPGEASSLRVNGERVFAAVFLVLRWLLGFGQPVVLMIDDWGRAEGRAAELYRRVLIDGELAGLHLLATERSDESFACAANCERIAIGRSSEEAERQLVSSITGLDAAGANVLLRLAAGTYETPFDLLRAAQSIRANGLIGRDANGGVCFDRQAVLTGIGASGCAQILAQCALDDPNTQQISRCIMLFGDRVEQAELKMATRLERDELEHGIAVLVRAGVLQPGACTLKHDHFSEAIAMTIPAGERRLLCSRVAKALRAYGVRGQDGQRGQLMLDRLLEGGAVDLSLWSEDLAAGAALARMTGDTGRATRFAEAALAPGGPHASFRALREGVFAAIEAGDTALALARADALAAAAADATALALADELRVFTYRMSGDQPNALKAAKEGLARHGVHVPQRVHAWEVLFEVVRLFMRDPERASRQPAMTDAELLAAAPRMRALAALGPILYEHDATIAFVVGARAITNRVASATAAGAAAQAVLCSETGLFKRAARWGAVSDARQSRSQPLRALAMHFAGSYGHLYARPRGEIGRGQPVADVAFAEGDIGTGATSLQYIVWDRLVGDAPLNETARVAEALIGRLGQLRDAASVPRMTGGLEIIRKLTDGGAEPWRLASAFSLASDARGRRIRNAERGLAEYQAMLGVCFGAYEQVAAIYDSSRRSYNQAPFHSQTQIWSFMTGLALLKRGRRPHWGRLWVLKRAAAANPAIFKHRATLLAAEAARQRGRAERALALYVDAVAQARGAACLMELGITAEAAREGCYALGLHDAAARFKETAGEAWRQYGAYGVLTHRGHEAPLAGDGAERDAAVRASKARARFLTLVGHELRTPLQGLSGLLELAEARGEAPDVAALRGGVQHINRVVGDLMDIAAADGGVLSVNATPLNVASLLDELVSILSSAPHGRGVAWQGRLSGDVIVAIDAVRLRQVLTGLVSNAWVHARTACEIEVSVEHVDADAVLLTFHVMDRGAGIPLERMTRLLEPFEKGEESAGFGLGLAVSRQLAKAMGGTLDFSNRDGGGAVFSLRLTVPRAERESAAASNTMTPRRVLVIEDDDLSRAVIGALLRLDHIDVSEAVGVNSALLAARAQRFDAVVIDRSLGDGDGIELLQELGADPSAFGTPRFIVMSASMHADLRQQALNAGADAVIEKPVTRSSLRVALGIGPDETPAVRRMDELRAALGDEAEQLLAAVRPNVMEAIARIEMLTQSGDRTGAQQEAHKLCGLAANFGLSELAAAAQAFELGAQGVSLAALRSMAERIDIPSNHL